MIDASTHVPARPLVVKVVAGPNAGRRLHVTNIGPHFVTGRMTDAYGRLVTAMVGRNLIDPAADLTPDQVRDQWTRTEKRTRVLRTLAVSECPPPSDEVEAPPLKRAM